MDDLYSGKKAVVGIIGLGYVGMPLALAAWTAGFRVVGFDIDPQKAASINAGKSYLRHIPSEEISAAVSAGRLRATTRFEEVRDVDAVIICVPTPLTAHREPDLTYIESTAHAIAPHLRKGQLIVLESTTWPGTTTEVMQPILERGGLKAGRDFFLAFSPEREDPGNASYPTKSIPKIVGADDPTSIKLANALYGAIVTHTIPVSSMKTAEAVKLTENIFRAVNIALVNELKVIYDAMGIDVWEVIEAAKSKPFGFMPFYPGPGLGGHCIPIDPFYLTWKAREFEISTRFIELAGEINAAMPNYVVDKLARSLDERAGRGLRGAKILMIGIAYKKNVEDIERADDVGADIGARILQAVAHPGLRGEMNDHVGTKLGIDLGQALGVLQHQFPGGELRRLQQDRVPAAFERHVVVGRHAVDADDVVAGRDQPLGHVEADEARRSGHKKAHSLSFCVLRRKHAPAAAAPRLPRTQPRRADPITP